MSCALQSLIMEVKGVENDSRGNMEMRDQNPVPRRYPRVLSGLDHMSLNFFAGILVSGAVQLIFLGVTTTQITGMGRHLQVLVALLWTVAAFLLVLSASDVDQAKQKIAKGTSDYATPNQREFIVEVDFGSVARKLTIELVLAVLLATIGGALLLFL